MTSATDFYFKIDKGTFYFPIISEEISFDLEDIMAFAEAYAKYVIEEKEGK